MEFTDFLQLLQCITMFLESFNYQHPSINFTTEIESENSRPFLDVVVIHDGSNFCTSLRRKKKFTGLYMDYSSLAPDKHKNTLISCLVFTGV